jgi:2-polyprenyl-3-methyl-5-hydroxy-6-metoxy-1,4-benzoquinol methylase
MTTHRANIFVYILARICEIAARIFDRASSLLHNLLPALLPPDQLSLRVARSYDPSYAPELLAQAEDVDDGPLDTWETNVLNRHKIRTGRMLVVAAGSGREALGIAERGVTAIGMDTNLVAVRIAQKRAAASGVPAWFQQASMFELPYKSLSFDYVIFSSGMYSAIPGSATRQAWLKTLRPHLKPDALIILSFIPQRHSDTFGTAVRLRLASILKSLPGTNPNYQPGDTCLSGHFMHTFQNEGEVRNELTEAGMVIQELNWLTGYAVLTFPVAPAPKPAA